MFPLNFTKLEHLFKGGGKLSQLLAAMLWFCSPGEEKVIFFFQRLPVSPRAMLDDVEHGDLRALAAKVDPLLSLNLIKGTIAAAIDP
jgi:hypothetical protein